MIWERLYYVHPFKLKKILFCSQIFYFSKLFKGSIICWMFKHRGCLNVWKNNECTIIKQEATVIQTVNDWIDNFVYWYTHAKNAIINGKYFMHFNLNV